MELEAIDERNMHSITEDPTLKSLRKKWKHALLNLVVSTRPLRHLVQIHGPSLFSLSSFVYWATKRLRSSFALAASLLP